MNKTLVMLAAVLLLGWMPLAAGVMAVISGAPEVATHAHSHHQEPAGGQDLDCASASTACPDSGVKECAWPESFEQRVDQPDGFRPGQLRVEPVAAPI
jgi:hypothetical protein